MSELGPLGAHLDEGPDAAALDRLWRERVRRKQQRRSWLPLGVAVAAAALVMVFLWPRENGPLALTSGRLPGGASSATERVAFDDGSVVTLDAGASFAVNHNDGDRFDTVLESGRVRLSVTPGGPRRWTIDCGIAKVVVVGTELVIDRRDEAVEVSVAHGRVLVQSTRLAGGEVAVGAGESVRVSASEKAGDVAPLEGPMGRLGKPAEGPGALDAAPAAALTPAESAAPRGPAPEVEREVALPSPENRPSPIGPTAPPTPAREASPVRTPTAPAPAHERSTPIPSPSAPGPSPMAEHGKSAAPPPETEPAHVEAAPSEPTPGALLDAADAARRSGDSPRAVALLEQFLATAPDDYRAPLAAFTLGRLEADVLGRPARAAAAFERALPRLPQALQADALARLALARQALGQRDQARAAARRYLESHPAGPRAAAMRALSE